MAAPMGHGGRCFALQTIAHKYLSFRHNYFTENVLFLDKVFHENYCNQRHHCVWTRMHCHRVSTATLSGARCVGCYQVLHPVAACIESRGLNCQNVHKEKCVVNQLAHSIRCFSACRYVPGTWYCQPKNRNFCKTFGLLQTLERPSDSVLGQGQGVRASGLQSVIGHVFTRSKANDSGNKAETEKARQRLENAVKELKQDLTTIPNMLTMTRILLTPVLSYLVLQSSYTLACGVFVFAGITDVLDGWIARNFKNQTSAMGSFLDPLADKLLVTSLYFTLTWVQLIPVPLTALVIARDIGLIAAAFYVRYISLPPPKTLYRFFDLTHPTAQLSPTLISKVNTFLQLSLVAVSLAAPVFDYIDHPYLQALWYLTGTTTVVSGIGYMFIKDTYKILSREGKKM